MLPRRPIDFPTIGGMRAVQPTLSADSGAFQRQRGVSAFRLTGPTHPVLVHGGQTKDEEEEGRALGSPQAAAAWSLSLAQPHCTSPPSTASLCTRRYGEQVQSRSRPAGRTGVESAQCKRCVARVGDLQTAPGEHQGPRL
jgi:hypothetical protein